MKKVVFKIAGMHCTSCALDIDGTLEDTAGVVSANTNYARSQTEVQFDEDKIQHKKITDILKNLGYEAVQI